MVFGLFKKKATPEEFGRAVFHLASDFLASDAGRSLGMRFENWDGSDGWSNFLSRKGMPMAAQKLHYRLFSHCAVQAVCTQFDAGTSKGITRGATVTAFSSAPDGYNFETTYATLEAAYRGQHKFDRRVEPLSNVDAHINFLPNQNVGVVNAKYLIESFVIPNMQNGQAFIDDFKSYSSTVCAAIGTVRRAMDHVFGSFKLQ